MTYNQFNFYNIMKCQVKEISLIKAFNRFSKPPSKGIKVTKMIAVAVLFLFTTGCGNSGTSNQNINPNKEVKGPNTNTNENKQNENKPKENPLNMSETDTESTAPTVTVQEEESEKSLNNISLFEDKDLIKPVSLGLKKAGKDRKSKKYAGRLLANRMLKHTLGVPGTDKGISDTKVGAKILSTDNNKLKIGIQGLKPLNDFNEEERKRFHSSKYILGKLGPKDQKKLKAIHEPGSSKFVEWSTVKGWRQKGYFLKGNNYNITSDLKTGKIGDVTLEFKKPQGFGKGKNKYVLIRVLRVQKDEKGKKLARAGIVYDLTPNGDK